MSDGWQPSVTQQERIAYRRRQSRRSVLLAAVSTVILVVVVVVALTSSPGWPRVRSTYLDLSLG